MNDPILPSQMLLAHELRLAFVAPHYLVTIFKPHMGDHYTVTIKRPNDSAEWIHHLSFHTTMGELMTMIKNAQQFFEDV